MITYYVVQPFRRGFRNQLQLDQPRQVKSEEQAIDLAERLARTSAGVVAFRRRGDPATGIYDDAHILAQHGAVPVEAFDEAS